MNLKSVIALAFLFTVIIIEVRAQPGDPEGSGREREVDGFMHQQMKARQIPGAAVAVVRNGKILLVKGYGMADLENETPVNEHTVFEIASVTKQFTATAIMILVQNGKLSIDDTITYLLDSLPLAWNGITIRHLLTHTSGLPDFSRPEFHMKLRENYSSREIIRLIENAPLDFKPGEKHSYSNTGYALLGMVIEKLSGMKYGEFLQEYIFKPLEMKDTQFNDRHKIIRNRARGYTLVDYTLQNAEYTSPTLLYAAGGLISSAADMAKWMAAQGSEKLLSTVNWQQMWTRVRLNDGTTANYGFGWNVQNNWSRERVEHGGGIEGFSTADTRYIADSLAIVFLSNLDGGHKGRLSWGISGIYLPPVKFNPPKPITDLDEEKTAFLHKVAEALSQGTGDPDWFTQRVQEYYFPDRIKARKKAFSMLGTLNSFELTEVMDDQGQQKRTYRAVFGTTPVRFTFWVTKDQKVNGVDFDIE